MNARIPTSKLLGALFFIGVAAGSSRLQAQTNMPLPFSGTQSSPATAFSLDTNGTLIEKGPLNTSATLTLSNGPQMIWFPAFAAFRVGSFSSSQPGIGQYSFATGYNAFATSTYSFATGFYTTSSGGYSFAGGNGSTASGQCSVAFGNEAVASGSNATAIGFQSIASGSGSLATGEYTTASGFNAFATGLFSNASGSFALAAGNQTIANSQASVALGQYTSANSLASVALGQYNTGLSSTGATPNATTWVATDPLLELGNGTGSGSSAKSDALVVYKNGAATFQGVVTVAPGGDIPMYTGNQ